MLLSFLLSIAVFAPQTPDADHAALAALFSKDVETRVMTSAQSGKTPAKAKARDWRGGDCRSSVTVSLPELPPLAYDIGWSRAAIRYKAGDRTVTVDGAMPPTRVPVTATLAFRFGDATTAEAAARAMKRRKAACTPQR